MRRYGDGGDAPTVYDRTAGPNAAAPAQPAAAPGAASNAVNPAYLSQLFPNGIPRAPVNFAGSPLQVTPQQIGALPQVNVDVGTDSIVNQILGSLNPQFSLQQRGLQDALANAGIVGGSTGGAFGDLARTQTETALGAVAPYIMQGKQLGIQEQSTNAANALQRGALNQQADLTGQQANQSAGLNRSEFNASNANNMGQFDVSNLIKSAMYDTGNYNQFLSQMMSEKNNDWLAQLQAQTQLNSGGANAQSGAFQPTFEQPTPVDFSQLGKSLAPTTPNSTFNWNDTMNPYLMGTAGSP